MILVLNRSLAGTLNGFENVRSQLHDRDERLVAPIATAPADAAVGVFVVLPVESRGELVCERQLELFDLVEVLWLHQVVLKTCVGDWREKDCESEFSHQNGFRPPLLPEKGRTESDTSSEQPLPP